MRPCTEEVAKRQGASSVHFTISCKHSLVLLRMGWLKVLIKLLLLHLVDCLYYCIHSYSYKMAGQLKLALNKCGTRYIPGMLSVHRSLRTIARSIFCADSNYCQSAIIQQWWKLKLLLLKSCASNEQCGGEGLTAACILDFVMWWRRTVSLKAWPFWHHVTAPRTHRVPSREGPEPFSTVYHRKNPQSWQQSPHNHQVHSPATTVTEIRLTNAP